MAKKTISSSSSPSIKDKALNGVGSLIRLLPTGTVFMFQFLSPVLTHNGHCGHPINRVLTVALLAACGFSCVFSTFTDSYIDSDGKSRYGIITRTGLWPAPSASSNVDMSVYKLRIGDFIHALFSVMVFAVLAILDNNTVECLFPAIESSAQLKTLLMVLPPVVGAVSGVVFGKFPSTRHGFGYPASSSSDDVLYM